MRTTVVLADELLAQAQSSRGSSEGTQLLREALLARVRRWSARRLVKLGGADAQLQAIPTTSECLCLCMILGDASVWIDHLSQGDAELMVALEAGEVGMYSFVVGELPCCNLRS